MRRHICDLSGLTTLWHLVHAHFEAERRFLDHILAIPKEMEQFERAGLDTGAALPEVERRGFLDDADRDTVLRKCKCENEAARTCTSLYKSEIKNQSYKIIKCSVEAYNEDRWFVGLE